MTENTTNLHGEELLAAELEGIAPMPADLIPLREEKLLVDKQLEELAARKKEIQEEFGKRLKEDGMVGYLLHAKVHARRSEHTRTSVDSKKLKDEMPHIYKNYLKVTAYTSVTVN
jgi:predicted phage-related endonuclease